MIMPDRKFQGPSYRFGFNGKENDNDVKGFGDEQDYGMRIYDDRLGRFLTIDPLRKGYPELTPYEFASNTPIEAIDLNGLEAQRAIDGSMVFGPVYMPRINQEIKRKNEAQNLKINSLSGNNLVSSSVGLSVPAVKAGIVRFKYMAKSSNLKSIYEHGTFEQKVAASDARNSYVLEARRQTPEPFLSFAEDLKSGSSLKNNPYGRFYVTNESVNIKMSVASGFGSALTM
jgi:RHS repeat-associated protein